MINTDYKIDALDILLDKACLSERYFPLIKYKNILLSELRLLGCKTKSDAANLPDEVLLQIGLNGSETIRLFRKFLSLYDPEPQKFKEIKKICSDQEEQAAFRELYCLPGVKQVRAALYYHSGYKSLMDFVDTAAEKVIERTALTISEKNLLCIAPFPKEVRTHIAVARAFTEN